MIARIRRLFGLQRTRDDRGFTLVGAMSAGTILSVLALCLVRGWGVFDGMTFDLVLRQKAVLVLNGEMERLWALYGGTSFGTLVASRSDYPSITGLPNSNVRASYAVNLNTTGFTTALPSTFTAQATPDATVFLGSGIPPLNWVWIDRPRGLVARLSWVSCAVVSPDVQACFGYSPQGKPPKATGTDFQCLSYSGIGTGTCTLITAVLEYPYAYNGGLPQAVGTTRTITLSTIVGRRS